MILSSEIRHRMLENAILGVGGGFLIGMGCIVVMLSDMNLAFLLVLIGVTIVGYQLWSISSVSIEVNRKLSKAQEQVKTPSIGQQKEERVKKSKKRIYQDDLCFKIAMKPGRENKPLMIVSFKKSSNFNPKANEWVPKLGELEFLEQTLKRISVYSI